MVLIDGEELAADPITYEDIEYDNRDNYYRLTPSEYCISRDTYNSLPEPKQDPLTTVTNNVFWGRIFIVRNFYKIDFFLDLIIKKKSLKERYAHPNNQ
jgi:hypothetical protein